MRRLFEYTPNPSISFSIPSDNNDILPVTIEEIADNITHETSIPEPPTTNTRQQTVRPYSLQLSAFYPTREIPRTPPNNNSTNSQGNNRQQTAVRPYGLQLFR